MKFLEVLASLVALFIDSYKTGKNRQRKEENREILDNPDPELERRGWLRSDSDKADVPNAGEDRDQ